MIDHRQWHLQYHILENKKIDVKNVAPKTSEKFAIVINLTYSNAWFEEVSLSPWILLQQKTYMVIEKWKTLKRDMMGLHIWTYQSI